MPSQFSNHTTPQSHSHDAPWDRRPSRVSGTAVASFVCGIILCIPFLTSLAAVITGWFGLRVTRSPEVRGRGLAIAGLILGIVGLVGWSAAGLGVWRFVESSAPARQFSRDYVADLMAGDYDTAASNSTSALPREDLVAFGTYLQTNGGALRDISFNNIHYTTLNGNGHWELGGTATFDSGPAAFSCTIRSTTSGFRMHGLHFQDAAGNWPGFQKP